MESITGRLTANAAIKKTKDQRELVAFSVAVNDRYKIKGGELKKDTRFFSCSYWVSTAIAAHLKKGMMVSLFGRVGLNAYKNSEGDFFAHLTFHANTIKILTGATGAPAHEETGAAAGKDDLPF